MASRADLIRKIQKKQQEIEEIRAKIREAEIYLQAYQEILRMFPSEDGDLPLHRNLKPDSAIGKARDAIKAAARPLHISEILTALGRPVDKNNRAAIGGSIAAYVRRGEVFTRPAPNTFGLVEMNGGGKRPDPFGDSEPPETFGKD